MLAEDETDLLRFPPLRAAWALRRQSSRAELSGRNARQVLFRTLTLRTGPRVLLARPRQRAEDFPAFLAVLHHPYRGWAASLLLDEDSSHTAHGSQALARALGIELLWLPKRAPALNPMDHGSRHGTQGVCANRQYATIDEEVARCIRYLLSLSPREALRKAGVLSPRFWLA